MEDKHKSFLAMIKLKDVLGKVSRREFMNIAVESGMTITAAALLWSTNLKASQPKYGGRFRLGIHDFSTVDTLNPGSFHTLFMIILNHTCRSYLTMVNFEKDVIGDLANDWESDDEAKTWRFKLHSGVEFHDGKTLSTQDVLASLEHHRKEGSDSAVSPLFSHVSDINVDGGDELIIELNEGNSDFPRLLSNFQLPICPSTPSSELDWESGYGNGAL